jgi:hypothetical protein
VTSHDEARQLKLVPPRPYPLPALFAPFRPTLQLQLPLAEATYTAKYTGALVVYPGTLGRLKGAYVLEVSSDDTRGTSASDEPRM